MIARGRTPDNGADRASDMLPAWQVLALVFAIAVVLNYPWELLQTPLFTPASNQGSVWLHCFVASLGDGIIVLLLLGCGWLVFGRRDWFLQPGLRGYILLLTAGALVAVTVEWIAVTQLQKWAYTEAMPRLPALQIGIVPVLQMLLLPPLIFRIAAAFNKRLASA